MKDILFLLTPGFQDGEGAPYYCPHCTIFEGLLHLYPTLGDHLDVRRVAYPRPRPDIIALLDADHQSCPVLILRTASPAITETSFPIQMCGDIRFIDDAEGIGNYLSAAYGIPRPH